MLGGVIVALTVWRGGWASMGRGKLFGGGITVFGMFGVDCTDGEGAFWVSRACFCCCKAKICCIAWDTKA